MRHIFLIAIFFFSLKGFSSDSIVKPRILLSSGKHLLELNTGIQFNQKNNNHQFQNHSIVYSLNLWKGDVGYYTRSRKDYVRDGMIGFDYVPMILNANDTMEVKGSYWSLHFGQGIDLFSKNETVDLITLFGCAYGRKNVLIGSEKFYNPHISVIFTTVFRVKIKDVHIGFRLDSMYDFSKSNWKTESDINSYLNPSKQHNILPSISLSFNLN